MGGFELRNLSYESSNFDELAEEFDLDAIITSDQLFDRLANYDVPVTAFSRLNWNRPEIVPKSLMSTESDSVRNRADIYTVVFSSGSSGRRKALLISKSGTLDLIEGFGAHYRFRSDDAILAFLPLSAFQQRWMVYTAIRYGFDFQLTDPLYLFKAFKEMAPTIFGAPPLFYENIESRIRGMHPLQFLLMDHIAGVLQILPNGLREWAQSFVFRRLHKTLGGRVRLMLTGGAPTRVRTIRLLRRFGLPIYEGYGLTETGYVSLNMPGSDRIGSVGKPLRPETVAISEGGEILTRWRKPLSLGYLNLSESENALTYLGNNTIATGDIGYLDNDGFLYVTGRSKEILVSRGGEKIHPEELEKELESHPQVNRAVVFHCSRDDGISVVVAIQDLNRLEVRDEIMKTFRSINQRVPKGLQVKTQVSEFKFALKQRVTS